MVPVVLVQFEASHKQSVSREGWRALGQLVKQYATPRTLFSGYKLGERPRVFFTEHALKRYLEMKLTADEIGECVTRPRRIGFSEKYNTVLIYGDRCTLSVGLDQGWPMVQTVLYRTVEDWIDAADGGVIGDGRTLHADMTHLERRDGATP